MGETADGLGRDRSMPFDGVFDMVRARIVLPTTSPFRLDLTVWALRRRATNAVDRWDGNQYTRVILLEGGAAKLSVTQERNQDPSLIVTIHSKAGISERIEREAETLVRKMLGTAVDLQPFYMLADDSDSLRPLVDQFLGVKPPRFASVFEALVNSIACQQVTLDLGIVLLNRLSARFGKGFPDHGVILHAFPAPPDLAVASEEGIKELGFSRQKARAIRELAMKVANNSIDLASIEDMTNQEAVVYLTTIRGIGRWSAEYVLLRGLGRLDTFPGDDIGAQNNLRRLFRLAERPNYDEIQLLTSQWHPYEGVVYFHLLLEKLALDRIHLESVEWSDG